MKLSWCEITFNLASNPLSWTLALGLRLFKVALPPLMKVPTFSTPSISLELASSLPVLTTKGKYLFVLWLVLVLVLPKLGLILGNDSKYHCHGTESWASCHPPYLWLLHHLHACTWVHPCSLASSYLGGTPSYFHCSSFEHPNLRSAPLVGPPMPRLHPSS